MLRIRHLCRMMDSTPGYQRFFAELKRRRVFKVAAIYGASSFVILQIADIVLPSLGLPQWTITFMVALIVFVFPVALIIAWAFDMTPEGVRKTDRASAEEIEAIVAEPASKRWPSGLLALAGVVALVLAAWWVGRQTGPGAAADADAPATEMRLALSETEDDSRPSIAVLPFLDMSPDGDQEYFSDGITEEILNTLVKIRDLKVTARTSAFAFKNSDFTAEQLGDTLRVRYLVEGSVRKADRQLRITAQLIDADDGSHLWSEQYDRSLDDVFAIQTEIAEAIAEELRVPLGLGEDERLVSPTEDLEAYDVYLAGRARMKERGESLREAIRLFEAAIDRDSIWAPGWAGLAEALEVIGWDSNDAAWVEVPTDRAERRAITNEFWRRSEQAARRAIELDPDNASAHVALGSILRNHRQWETSEAAYLQALASDPDNAEAYQQYSQLLFYVGRLTEAVQVGGRAVALDRAPVRLMIMGMVLQGAGLDDEALEVVEEGIRLDPEGPLAGSLSGFKPVILWGSRRFEDLGDLARDSGQPPELVDQVIDALQSGNLDGLPPELRAELQQNPFLPMVLEHHDQAAEQLLESARTDPLRALQMIWMPLFDPIRDHPAYLETLRVLDLEGVTPDRPAQ